MKNFVINTLRACLVSSVILFANACYDTDEFYAKHNKPAEAENTPFDFSTVQDVELIVDYSDYDIHGQVAFRIYSENPIVNEADGNGYVDESIEPIFEAYTDERGIFDDTITLPAYAKVLHIVTGNFMIGLKRNMVEVVDGAAHIKVSPKVDGGISPSTKAPAFRAPGPGTQTNDISTMPSLSFNYANKNGTLGERVYKDWNTPLGTWDSASGRPSYLMDPATASPELVFSDEIVNGLYETVCAALNSGVTCRDEYRKQIDLTLLKDSELSICALGAMTCWNSSLGYYYYSSDNPPQSPMDLNIIMLFPNTQDGHRYEPVGGEQYQNNIGMLRGDTIQLLYYPNIADGDFTTVSTMFPKGLNIGLILKPNSWSNQGRTYCTKKGTSYWDNKMNIWATSTDGMSYCNTDLEAYRMANLTGEARTAEFCYVSPEGRQYVISAVEDACDDQDYDDLVFALNPSDAFAPRAQVTAGNTKTRGVYAFEDRWPNRADYDMNDVVLDVNLERTFSTGKIKKQIFRITTYQNYVSDISGLAVSFEMATKPQSVVMKKRAVGTEEDVAAAFEYDGEAYYLTTDVTSELGSTYIFEITYAQPQQLSSSAKIHPFIYRNNEDGTRWEVHIPNEAPTSKMTTSFFRTFNDCSDISNGKWYLSNDDYPFAFYLENGKIEYFQDTILKRENESKNINLFFPGFIDWSTSHGKRNANWYLFPAY